MCKNKCIIKVKVTHNYKNILIKTETLSKDELPFMVIMGEWLPGNVRRTSERSIYVPWLNSLTGVRALVFLEILKKAGVTPLLDYFETYELDINERGHITKVTKTKTKEKKPIAREDLYSSLCIL